MTNSIRTLLRLLYPLPPRQQLSTQQRNQLIQQKFEMGETLTDLANEFGISPQRIFQLVHRKHH